MSKCTIKLKVAEVKASDRWAKGGAKFEPADLFVETEIDAIEEHDGEVTISLNSLNKLIEELREATVVLLDSDNIKTTY